MTVKFRIIDGRGQEHEACVTSRGELAVNDIKYSDPYSVEADGTGAFNLTGPSAGQRFVIKNIVFSTGNTVGANGAIIQLYEASSSSSTTVDKNILQATIAKQELVPVVMNTLVTAGKWINFKTDDPTVYCSIYGYYVDA